MSRPKNIDHNYHSPLRRALCSVGNSGRDSNSMEKKNRNADDSGRVQIVFVQSCDVVIMHGLHASRKFVLFVMSGGGGGDCGASVRSAPMCTTRVPVYIYIYIRVSIRRREREDSTQSAVENWFPIVG